MKQDMRITNQNTNKNMDINTKHIIKVKPVKRIKTSSTGLACIPSGNPPDAAD